MAELHEPFEANQTYQLKVSSLHEIYVEESGNPQGHPVIFVHGGPGGATSPDHRRFFDPTKFRIILFDQRGCGKSTPYAELKENSTWKLVSDMEVIRKHLRIDKWFVFGGSWGSTLSLSYAIRHPDQVKALILRGIFLCRPEEIRWFYQEGCHRIYPDAWEHYLKPIPVDERGDLVKAFYKRLTDSNPDVRIAAAKAWSVWEGSTSKLIQDAELIEHFDDPEFAVAFARIECHYFINNAFFPTENWLLENCKVLAKIPIDVVHGRYDVVCPIESAWALKRALPHLNLHITPDAGHAAMEPGTRSKLIEIMNAWGNK